MYDDIIRPHPLPKNPLSRGVPNGRGVSGHARRPVTTLPYNPKLKQLARELRSNSTLAEVLLWRHLKQRQRAGYDFHRQKPVGDYIVDFFFPTLMMAIEIDGESHLFKGSTDDARQVKLQALGIRFLRFDDAMVKTHLEGVIRAIDHWIAANAP